MVIRRTEQPPQNRLDAKDVKEIAADANAFCFADLPARGQIEPLVGPNGNFGEAFLALADLLPHGKGELGILAGELAGAPVAVCDSNRPQLLRALDGDGGQADGVNELEDSGGGADSEMKKEDGDEVKAGPQAQKPQ